MEKIHHLLESFPKVPTLVGFLLGLIIRPTKNEAKEKPSDYFGDNMPFTLIEQKTKNNK